MRYFVYILKSGKDGNYYIGYTQDLKYRLKRHFEGTSSATKSRLPLELVAYKEFNNKKEAIETEKDFKRRRSRRYIEIKIVEWVRSSVGRAPPF